MLYFDQPVGTGWSYSDIHEHWVTDEEGLAKDFYSVLQEFYRRFPKYRSSPLHIFGESYAGRFSRNHRAHNAAAEYLQ